MTRRSGGKLWRARMFSSAAVLNSGASSVAGDRLIDRNGPRARPAAPATIVSTQASSSDSRWPLVAAAAKRLLGVGERRRRDRPDQPLDAQHHAGAQLHDRLVDRTQPGSRHDLGHRRAQAVWIGRGRDRAVEDHHFGAPGTLGGVQRRIGLAVQLGAPGGGVGERRDAGREGEAAGVDVAAQRGLQRGRQQAPDHDLGGLGIGLRQEDGELVAADPEGPIHLAQPALHQRAEVGQRLVAEGVALGVIDRT